jgi:hypothetical protein
LALRYFCINFTEKAAEEGKQDEHLGVQAARTQYRSCSEYTHPRPAAVLAPASFEPPDDSTIHPKCNMSTANNPTHTSVPAPSRASSLPSNHTHTNPESAYINGSHHHHHDAGPTHQSAAANAAKKAKQKKATDPNEASKLIAAKISQLELGAAEDKEQEAEIGWFCPSRPSAFEFCRDRVCPVQFASNVCSTRLLEIPAAIYLLPGTEREPATLSVIKMLFGPDAMRQKSTR